MRKTHVTTMVYATTQTRERVIHVIVRDTMENATVIQVIPLDRRVLFNIIGNLLTSLQKVHQSFSCISHWYFLSYIRNESKTSVIKFKLDCRLNSIGVSNKKTIPDAQLSAYLSRDQSLATEARLNSNSSSGWCGENGNAWIQVDLGTNNVCRITARMFDRFVVEYLKIYFVS